MSQSKVCDETVSDEQTARRRPVPVREPSGKASAAPAQVNRPCLVSRSFVIVAESSCLPVECLFECAQFVGRERSLDGLRIETVRHQWDDVLRQDEVLGLPEDDQTVFVDGGAGGEDVGDVDILLVRASTISGVAGVLHRDDLGRPRRPT